MKSFHGILGHDSLEELNAVIHVKEQYMLIDNVKKIKIYQHISQSINKVELRTDHLNKTQIAKLEEAIQMYPNLFTEPNHKLTYTSRVQGEIRTTTDTPVFSKTYPYPMALKSEIEKQVLELLNDGIIRPSKSPYNAPVWIVPKKMDASGEKKYRMVIDYRKLNSITVPDRYPIPEINEVLSNLGENKYFSVIDLKSGFHQIPLKESDIEKTAFSINNGKFEFVRLPFGLKNSPSIFQRTLDDVLREHIGKICYVYIDDIIIFGKNETDHFQNLHKVFRTLESANFKVQLDKCEFAKQQIEFLGFIVDVNGIKTNPDKVRAIVNISPPKTLKDLRSFLGMSGYYRRFIRDYAKLAKPLTSLLRGEDGRVSKNASKNRRIFLDQDAIDSFQKIKNSMTSEDIILSHPNFEKDFDLTTDASEYAIGAVLSQDRKPITFLSRTLNKTEEHYATNEKEMLAIIWALTTLRNYLYGSRKINIFTDHQPLTFALSSKNTNSKMKRWKAILEEYNYELKYQPGKTNIVADALSRPPQINSMTATQHSSESSSHNLIPAIECPINAFKNQLFILVDDQEKYEFKIPFPTYHRHVIKQPHYSKEDLITVLKKYLNPSVINGLFTSEPIMGIIQEFYPEHFKNFKVRFTQSIVQDITNESEQEEIIISEHKRAHRNGKENREQIRQKYYFPKMAEKTNRIVKTCKICKEQKYDRHPNKPSFEVTPIPKKPGEIIHVDIYSTEKNLVLTAIDKFSKYAQAKILKSRAIEDIKEPLRELILAFGVPNSIVIDNEKSLNSATIKFLLQDQFGINIYTTPPYCSSVNGQVERFHSTLSEIMRCLKPEKLHTSFHDLLTKSIYEYNSSIHSVTRKKPIEIFFGRKCRNQKEIEDERKEISNRLKEKQEQDLEKHNKDRDKIKNYSVGEKIYVKVNKRLGSKLSPRYREEIVKEDRNTTILTNSGKIVHKSNIKR